MPQLPPSGRPTKYANEMSKRTRAGAGVFEKASEPFFNCTHATDIKGGGTPEKGIQGTVKNRKRMAAAAGKQNSFYDGTDRERESNEHSEHTEPTEHRGAFKTYSKCKFKDAPKYAKHTQIT